MNKQDKRLIAEVAGERLKDLHRMMVTSILDALEEKIKQGDDPLEAIARVRELYREAMIMCDKWELEQKDHG